MHGSHFLNDEYKISATRLIPPKNSCENFNFARSKMKAKSSPMSKRTRLWRGLRRLLTATVTIGLLVLGVFKSVGPRNISRIYGNIKVIAAYIAPRLLMMKRSLIPNLGELSRPPRPPKIMEILSPPLHLIIALGNLDEAKKLLQKDATAHLITPNHQSNNHTFNSSSRIHFDNSSASIFESMTFSICKIYRKQKQYPTKLSVTGSVDAGTCVVGRYRWALKIPKHGISFHSSNYSLPSNFTKCSNHRNDPFDCNHAKIREDVRLRYSQLCPDLSPFLLACTNRLALERALAYTPPWFNNEKM